MKLAGLTQVKSFAFSETTDESQQPQELCTGPSAPAKSIKELQKDCAQAKAPLLARLPQRPTSPPASGLLASQINDASQPLAKRIQASQEHPFNTLYLDRNCASCMSGLAPQILSQIKLACLSYVNSPIKYAITYAGGRKNPQDTSN